MARRRDRWGVLVVTSTALLGLDWPGQSAARAAEFARADTGRRIELLHLVAPSAEPEAQDALAAGLADAEPGVREVARQLAIRFPSEALIGALLRTLEDPDTGARADALDALAGIRGPDARRAIERALSDRSPEVRSHAVRALSSGGADALVALLDRVHDPEGDVRTAAAAALGRIGDPRAALALVGISQDPIPEVRLAATRALGTLPGEVSTRALLALIHDALPEVRLAALRGMQGRVDPTIVQSLAALSHPDLSTSLSGRDEMPRAAIAALGRIDSAEARRALVGLALEPRSLTARAAVEALLPHPERLRPEVSTILAGMTRENVGTLASLLGRVGGDAVALTLLEYVDRGDAYPDTSHPEAEIGATLLRELGRTGSDLALTSLLERLAIQPATAPARRPSGCSRSAVDAPLLDAIGLWADTRGGLDPLAVDPLVDALGRLDLACTTELAMTLRLIGRTGNPRAAATLIPMLRHHDASVRRAAAQALGRAVSAEGVPALVAAMSDPDDAVRTVAASSLRAHASGAVAAALARRWSDPSPVDRSGLLLALGRSLANVTTSPPERAAGLPLILRAASAGSLRSRCAAVRALGFAAAGGDGAALGSLVERALGDAETALAAVAIEAIGNLPPAVSTPATRAAVDRALERSEQRATGGAAAWALRSSRGGAVESLRALLDRRATDVVHNALAALARIDLGPLTAEARETTRAAVQRLLDARPALPTRVNACAAVIRLGGSCPEGSASTNVVSAPQPIDLRVLDAAREPVSRPVLVRFADGVSVWLTPDVDGWISVRDTAAGPIDVLDRASDEP